jgi:hypothetical protein
MLVFVEGGKPENPEKNPQSMGENQQQTQLTYDMDFLFPSVMSLLSLFHLFT